MGFLRDHNFVHEMTTKLEDLLREHRDRGGTLDTPRHQFTPQELVRVHAALKRGKEEELNARKGRPAAEPYFARDPLVSLIQSAMHEQAVTDAEAGAPAREHVRMGDDFTPLDIMGWGVDVGLSLIGRLLEGSHPFEDAPAQAELDDSKARLILVSDWGTGMADDAGKVIAQAAKYLEDSDRETHVIHLGDTYYSGTEFEAQKHVLDLWPFKADKSDRLRSWALNGNHDMYSGGYGYFQTTLGDKRFSHQSVNDRPTSWFHLKGSTWDVVGLDTAYKDPVAAFEAGDLFLFGRLGFLHGSQSQYVNDLKPDGNRRLLLLSHHQLFSAYDDDISRESVLRKKLRPTLDGKGVDAWFWGHEHDCLAYEAFRGVRAARAIGHGAVPTLRRSDPPGTLVDPAHRVVKPTAPADTPADHPLRYVEWEYRDFETGDDGEDWAKHGFAVVDMSPDRLQVRCVDQNGEVYLTETITP
jgi:calcineurin-like phosphoesterase family protein